MAEALTPRIRIVCTLIVHCLCLSLIIYHHAMWGDETHAWQIAIASANPMDLAANARYEMHPLLWFAILYIAKQFSVDPNAMKVVHVLIAEVLAYVVLRYAPFRWGVRVGLIFSAIFFFEYGVISRNYSIGVLCLLIACAIPKTRCSGLVLTSVALFFATQCNAFAMLIAAVYGTLLVIRQIASSLRTGTFGKDALMVAIAASILVAGVTLSILQLKSPSDTNYPVNYVPVSPPVVLWFLERIGRATVSEWMGTLIGDRAQLLVSILTVGCVLALLPKRWFELAFYFTAMAPVLAFDYLGGLEHARHIYHFFIIFLMALWMAESDNAGATAAGQRLGNARNGVLAVILMVQFAGCVGSCVKDWTCPMSRAKDVANFIKSHGLEDLPIGGYQDIQASNVTAYLGRRIFSFQSDSWRTFIVWERPWVYRLTTQQLAARIQSFAQAHPDGCLILLNPDQPAIHSSGVVTVLAHFNQPCSTDYTFTLVFMAIGKHK